MFGTKSLCPGASSRWKRVVGVRKLSCATSMVTPRARSSSDESSAQAYAKLLLPILALPRTFFSCSRSPSWPNSCSMRPISVDLPESTCPTTTRPISRCPRWSRWCASARACSRGMLSFGDGECARGLPAWLPVWLPVVPEALEPPRSIFCSEPRSCCTGPAAGRRAPACACLLRSFSGGSAHAQTKQGRQGSTAWVRRPGLCAAAARGGLRRVTARAACPAAPAARRRPD